jgi:hypothetical protein
MLKKNLTPENRGLYFKITIVWLAIVMVFSFWLSVRNTADPIVLTAMPSAPHQGDPVVATYKLNNPTSATLVTRFEFYINGELLRDGQVTLAPGVSQTFEDVYTNTLPTGQQVNFMVKTQSGQGNFEKLVSTPPVPPQTLSSFISFATFSTSIMTYMTSMVYYNSGFGTSNVGFNIGLFLTLVLLALLIFLELTDSSPSTNGRTMVLGRLKIRFSTVTWVLLIIFLGVVYTRVVMIITG